MGEPPHTSVAFKQFNTLFKYKNKHVYSSTQERRETFLLEQKEKRHKLTDKSRQQFELFINTPHDDGNEEMECEELQNKKKKFKFVLMNTEWFTEIPEDLEQNWFVKCAPEGFRVMLVSRRRVTICYNNKGRSVLKLKSNFSGGGGKYASNGVTVLDCIYNKKTKTVFILDCLCWNNMSMVDADAEFRFFWLKSKLTDDLELSQCKNYRFVLIDSIPAQRPLIQDAMFRSFQINENTYYFDGIVFYHKHSHYYFGDTPLVGWLASYMLPELLHIDVSQEHLFKVPQDYKGACDYILNLKSKTKDKKIKRNNAEGIMDVS